jgi:hypothetical protein
MESVMNAVGQAGSALQDYYSGKTSPDVLFEELIKIVRSRGTAFEVVSHLPSSEAKSRFDRYISQLL